MDVSRLGIEVESKGIKEATADLDKLANAADKAESASSNLKTSSSSLSTTQKSATSTTDKLIQKFQQQVDLLGANTEKTFSYKAAAKGLSDQQQNIAAQLGAQVDSYKALIAQQQASAKQAQESARAAEAYSKAWGQAIEINKRMDAKSLADALKEQEAAARADAQAFNNLAREADNFTKAWGQANEMNKRFDRQSQERQWRELGKAQSEAIRIDKQYNAQQAATSATLARTEAQQRSFIASLKDQAETYKMTASQLTAYRAAQLGVSGQAAPYIRQLQDIESGLTKTGISAKQTAFAFRMLPAQFSDISVQLAGGQNPFLILLQQGSQIKDSFGGIIPTFKAFAEVLTPVRLALGGLAVAVGTVGFAVAQASTEWSNFNKQMILTNGYAGITKNEFLGLAASLSSVGTTKNAAASALSEVASTGKFAADSIGTVTKAALQMQITTGQAVEKTIEQFVAIEKDPVKAIQTLNEKYHFLNASILEQIASLESQGEHADAVRVATEAYASMIDKVSPKVQMNLSIWEKAWKSVASTAREAWNWIGDIGRDHSLDEQIKALEDRRKKVSNPGKSFNPLWGDSDQRKLDSLQMQKQMELDSQSVVNTQNKIAKEGVEAFDKLNKAYENLKGPEKLSRDLNNLKKDFEDLNRSNPGSKLLAGVSFDTSGSLTGASKDSFYQKQVDELKRKDIRKGPTNENDISKDLQTLQNQYKLEEKALRNHLDTLKIERQSGSIDEDQFLKQSFEAEQNSLTKRLEILNSEKEVAARKKNKTAMERITGEITVLEQEYNDNFNKYSVEREKMMKKDALDVQLYSQTLAAAYKTRQLAINNSLAGATLGDVAKGELQRQLAVVQEFDAKMKELIDKREKRTISEDTYQKETELLKYSLEQRLQLEKKFNEDSAALRGDWTVGAEQAYNSYLESVKDVAGQTKSLFSNAFSGMNDALTNFVMTGKGNFGDFAKSIIAQIVKMQAAAATSSLFGTIVSLGAAYFGGSGVGSSLSGPMLDASGAGFSNSLGSAGLVAANGAVFNGGSSISKFEDGGAFTNGVVSNPTNFNIGQMGEAGPEAIVPLTRTSDGSLGVTMKGGGGDVSVQNNITINQDGSANTEASTNNNNSESATQFAQLMANTAKQVIAQEQRQGGLIWKMMNGTRY